MTNRELKESLINSISDIKGNGSYYCYGKMGYLIPKMKIDSKLDVSFPLLPETATKLIDHAQRAPYGKGHDTLIDTEVRNTWEIDGSKITFGNPDWKKLLNKILDKVKGSFSLEDVQIEASLYKLLIYEKGGFFLKHKDTEKEEGMFASLIINLPSEFAGGELEIEWMGESVKIDFSRHIYDIAYAAFYSDCDHEVHKVDSGYRISLVYNLIKKDNGNQIGLSSLPKAVDKIGELLIKLKENEFRKPYLLLLDHQYTQTNFSVNKLKDNDINKAEAILQAAQKAGYFVDLGLLNHHVSGTYEDDYYDNGYGYGGEIDAESVTMSEVYEEYVMIEDWLGVFYPAIKGLNSDEVEILNNRDYLNLEEAIDTYAEGYMGNYGPSLEYDYRIGAILLMPFHSIGSLIENASESVLLGWIEYFIDNDIKDVDFDNLVNNFLSRESRYESWEKDDLDILVDCMTQNLLKNKNEHLISYLAKHFNALSPQKAISLVKLLKNEEVHRLLFTALIDEKTGNFLTVLELFYELESRAETGLPNILSDYSALIFENTSHIFKASGGYNPLSKDDDKVVSKILKTLLKISDHLGINNFLEPIFSKSINRKFIHQELAPIVKKYQSNRNALWQFFYRLTIDNLRLYTETKPIKPSDWKRDFDYIGKMDTPLEILKDFLLDSEKETLVYIRAQKYRNHMEYLISHLKLDISCLTVKRGSPHQLHLIKNLNSLKRKLKEYDEDRRLLDSMESVG